MFSRNELCVGTNDKVYRGVLITWNSIPICAGLDNPIAECHPRMARYLANISKYDEEYIKGLFSCAYFSSVKRIDASGVAYFDLEDDEMMILTYKNELLEWFCNGLVRVIKGSVL